MTRNSSMLALLGAWSLFAATTPSFAQTSPAPTTLDMREADASWVNDPQVHLFYRLTVAAFANGAQRVDRPAYEAGSRALFRALAVARHMSPEDFEKHAAAIPGQMIDIVSRDPRTLDTYGSFVVALFGPQPGPIQN